MPTTYGYEIRFSRRSGGASYIQSQGYETVEAARIAKQKDLLAMGWEPPRWWQWWRWRDVPRRWPVLSIEL